MQITEDQIVDAMAIRCGVCKAGPGQPCVNVCTQEPLSDRAVHWYRIEPR